MTIAMKLEIARSIGIDVTHLSVVVLTSSGVYTLGFRFEAVPFL